MTRRPTIKCPFDFITIPPFEKHPNNIHATFDVLHHAIVTYAVDPASLQRFLHRRYVCETFTNTDGKEKALVSVVISRSTPHKMNRLERFLDPPPYNCVSYRCLVLDKYFWQRSSWQFGTFLKSMFYCKIPRVIYGLPLFNAKVNIEQRFDMANMRYDDFRVSTDGLDGIGKLDLSLDDTGVPLLESPTFTGFDNNESALAALALPCEYVTKGMANLIYRQGTQCTPFHPSVGKLKHCSSLSYLTDGMGITDIDISNPHSVLLQRSVENMQTLAMEAHIDDENDPHSAARDVGMNARIQRKAMNRAFTFRDEIRDKSYEEAESMRANDGSSTRDR